MDLEAPINQTLLKGVLESGTSRIDNIFLDIAESISEFSNCQSIHVGAVIVNDGRIISTGYNGSPPGFYNCSDVFPDKIAKDIREDHHQWSLRCETHAEMNSLLYAAKNGVSVNMAIMYCTHQPCHSCLRHSITAGIQKIIFRHLYDKADYTQDTIDLIVKSKVRLINVNEPNYTTGWINDGRN